MVPLASGGQGLGLALPNSIEPSANGNVGHQELQDGNSGALNHASLFLSMGPWASLEAAHGEASHESAQHLVQRRSYVNVCLTMDE